MLFGKNNSAALARRDPARASLLGAITGADFGVEGRARRARSVFAGDPWGNFGADGVAMPAPTPQAMQDAWHAKVRNDMANARREQLIDPNKDVNAKVERYAMPTSQAITIGTAAVLNMIGNPTVDIRPQRVVSNAPCPAFAFLSRMSVANVNVLVGPGVQDAWDYAAEANGTSLDIPKLTASNPITVQGNYTGLIPAGYNSGLATYFCLTYIGWASVTA